MLTRRYTDDGVAYHLYLKGRYCWNQVTQETLIKAITYFEQATAYDPRYALAYTGIADSYLILGSWATGALRFLRGEARFDCLRDDLRFSDLTRRLGLADPAAV